MAVNLCLMRFLIEQGVHHRVEPHLESYTAQEVAASSHIPGGRLAKVLVLKDREERFVMAMLPAPRRVDLDTLGRVTGRHGLVLATEEELGGLFPDCDRGSMPPFGNLYGMPVYAAECFPRSGEFAFQAGNHHEVVWMRWLDYERLVKPKIADFCVHESEQESSAAAAELAHR